MTTIDTSASTPDADTKLPASKPEKPDEDQYKADVEKAKKELAAAQEATVSPPQSSLSLGNFISTAPHDSMHCVLTFRICHLFCLEKISSHLTSILCLESRPGQSEPGSTGK